MVGTDHEINLTTKISRSTVVVIVYVEKVMAIALLCESPQQFRVLMMILQYHKTLSMISMMLSNALSCVSETSQVLSPVLF